MAGIISITECSAQPNIHLRGLSRDHKRPRISGMLKRGPHRPKPKTPPRQEHRNNIKNWRIYREMTVEELADQSGMSTGNISALENQRQGYSPEGLKKLAKALDTTPSALIDVNPMADEATASFWELWEKANAEDRQTLTIMAERLTGGRK